MANAFSTLEQTISDGYAMGKSSPIDAGHVLTIDSADGDTFAYAYITHGDGGTRVAMEESDDMPDSYWVRGQRVASRADVVHAIAGLC